MTPDLALVRAILFIVARNIEVLAGSGRSKSQIDFEILRNTQSEEFARIANPKNRETYVAFQREEAFWAMELVPDREEVAGRS